MPNCRVRARVRVLYRTALLLPKRDLFSTITLPQLYLQTYGLTLCGLTLHKRSQVAQALSLQKIIVQRTP